MTELKVALYRAGSLPEEPGEQICPAAEDCGGGEEARQRVGAVQNGEEEAEEKLSGRHAQAAADRGRDEPVPSEEGEEAHAAGLGHHRRCVQGVLRQRVAPLFFS